MFDQPKLRLRIQTLEASNKRLRKHLREAKQISTYPSSTKLTNCVSQEIIPEFKSCKSIEQSGMSINTMLNKGMDYLITRYQSDIKKVISYLEDKTKMDHIFPFSSDSPKLFEQLTNRIYKLKIESRGNHKSTKPSNLNKLIGDYNKVVTDNESKTKLILDLQEIIERLHYQEQKSKINDRINKIMSEAMCQKIHRQYQWKPINKFRSVVNVMRFSFRLNKTQKQVKSSVQSANIKLVESPSLYSKLYKSFCYGFQFEENEASIKKYISKDPQKSLVKLLNHQIFFDRIVRKPIIFVPKTIQTCLQKQKQIQIQKQINAEQLLKLKEEMLNTYKLYEQIKVNNSSKLQQYKQKVKNLNSKVTNLQSKIKKIGKYQ